jgi:cbb3-type cytochrome oxidase maturation protein
MNSIYLLIPVTGVFLGIAIWAFIWAVNNDQFDDMDSAATRILFDDDEQATIDAIKQEDLKKPKDRTTAIKIKQDNTDDH